MRETISYVALFTGIASIILAIVAVWLAIAFKKHGDDINRDTTQKLARIEAFASSTKQDAFAELSKWSEYARTGGKISEEAEKAKEEELRKLKEELEASTDEQINKVLEAVETRLRSTAESSDISEIRKEFELLKDTIVQIQERSIGEVKKLDADRNFKDILQSFPPEQRKLLLSLAINERVNYKELETAGITRPSLLHRFLGRLIHEGVLLKARDNVAEQALGINLRPSFEEFLVRMKDEMD